MRIPFFGFVVLLAASLTQATSGQTKRIELPKPNGAYSVGTTTYEWTDRKRKCSYSSQGQDCRRIFAQIWYPSIEDSNAQKAPYSTTSNGYENVFPNSRLNPLFADGLSNCPLILICPGRGVNHFAYSAIAESLSSHGYVVAAMGMPRIGNVVFSDGYHARPDARFQPPRGLMAGPYEKVDEFFETPTEMGRQDLEFALVQLRALNEGGPNGRFPNKIDLSNIGIFGHSLGGRIAGAFAASNTNVNAYISMEGIAPRRARFEGLLAMPVAMMCSSGTLPYAQKNYQTLIDGRKKTVFMIELQKFGHNSVTDLPLISPSRFNYEIDPALGLKTSIKIVGGFFNAYLKDGSSLKDAMHGVENVVLTEHAEKESLPPPLVITNCQIVSVNDGTILKRQMIVIEHGIISYAGPMKESGLPESARVIDAINKFVMPGLVDMHVHIGHESELISYLLHGVTTVCNLGGDYLDLFSDEKIDICKLRSDVASGEVTGPRIFTAGQALDGDPRTGPYQRALSSPAAAAEAVVEQKKRGFDFIKVYDALDGPTLKAIIRTATENELAVIGHIPEKPGVEATLASGIQLIAHAEEFYPAFEEIAPEDFEEAARKLAARVKRSGVSVTPNTAFVRRLIAQLEDLPAVLADKRVEGLAPRVRRWWTPEYNYYTRRENPDQFLADTKRKYQWMIPFVRELHKAEVPLLTGTDSSIPGALPGYSMMEEFKDLRSAGLTPKEILQTATLNPARFLKQHVSDKIDIGEIRKGFQADLVLLHKNPLERLNQVDTLIDGVIHNGRYATRDQLQKIRAEQKSKFKR